MTRARMPRPHEVAIARRDPRLLGAIEVRAVRPEVGNVRNNGPELITPREEEPAAVTLF